MPENELKDRLEAIGNDTLIDLKSDKESRFESFVKVIDILKQKQYENFAITHVTQ